MPVPAPTPPPSTTAAGVRLLDAAEDLFYWRGIGAVGVDLVADTAGVTKRTLYQRFGSKQELVAAYLQRRAHRWQTHLLAELDDVPPADQALAVYDVAARWSQQHSRGCAFVNAWAELGGTGDSTDGHGTGNHAVDRVHDEKRWMRDLFDALAPDDVVAGHLHLLYEGAAVTSTTMRDPEAYAAARDAAGRVLDRRPGGSSVR